MSRRLIVPALGLTAALGLAACAGGTVNGSAVPAGPGSPSATPSGPSVTQKAGGPTIAITAPNVTGSANQSNALRLSASLGSGLATAKTARVQLTILAAGESITAHGTEQLHNGKATAIDLTETIPGVGDLRIIMVGTRSWVKLPTTLNTGGKPWDLVSASSSNPTVRTLAGSLGSTQSTASIDSIIDFVSAASSIELVGSPVTDGIPTTRYKISVDTSRLRADYPGKSTLVGAGVDDLPVEMSIDAAGRPIRVSEAFSVQGQSVSTKIDITHYNEPVTITAPPPSLINPH